jgi:hypothetical protein
MLEGVAVLRRQPRILVLVLLAGFVAVCGWPLLVLLPAFSDRLAGHGLDDRLALLAAVGGGGSVGVLTPPGAHGYSVMLSAVGVGALLAGLTAATYGSEKGRFWFLAGGMTLVSASLGGLSQARDLALAATLCGAFGFGMILMFSTGQAAVQLSVDGAHRGKVMGLWAMVLSGGAPLGNLIFGPAADAWGVTAVLAGQSIALAIGAGLLILRRVHR